MDAFRSFLHVARSTEARYAPIPWAALLIVALPGLVHEALESSGHLATVLDGFGPVHWLLLELLRGCASDRPASGAELCMTVLGLALGGALAAWLDRSATRGSEPRKDRARSARRLHVR